MRSSLLWIMTVCGVGVGFALGYVVGADPESVKPKSAATPEQRHAGALARPATGQLGQEASFRRAALGDERAAKAKSLRPPRDRQDSSLGTSRSDQPRSLEDDEDIVAHPDDRGVDAPEPEVEELQKEVAALRAERAELMGSSIDPPPEVAARFAGPSLSSAVRDALASEKVEGDVEATDCSEHPCIIFGRLKGDEEEIEEVERSSALAQYKGDVLTLLFWATSVDEEEESETGLFALAFYTRDERASMGDDLDRRIRTRVMEYWNTDRPDRRDGG